MTTTSSEFFDPERHQRRVRGVHEHTFEIPIAQVVQTGMEGWVMVTANEHHAVLPHKIQIPIEATERPYVGQVLRITIKLVPEDAL